MSQNTLSSTNSSVTQMEMINQPPADRTNEMQASNNTSLNSSNIAVGGLDMLSTAAIQRQEQCRNSVMTPELLKASSQTTSQTNVIQNSHCQYTASLTQDLRQFGK